MTTPIKTLHSRLDRLEQPRDGDRFALEVADRSELPGALAHWRRHHHAEPLMVLVVPPPRAYEPDWPTA